MNASAIAMLIACAIAVVSLPRRWATIPIIIGVCYITRAQGINLGPYSFTPVRLLIVVGLVRLVVRREWLSHGANGMDGLVLAWGCWMVLSTFFHVDPSTQMVNRFGLVLDGWGLYFLFRAFCGSRDEVTFLCRSLPFLLAPIAVAMVFEKLTAHNPFSVFGGVPAVPQIREGHVRAQGPFAHAILAGNIGGVIIPLICGLWAEHKKTTLLGVGACLAMLFASSSSGPIMTAVFGVFALFLWPYRDRMYLARRGFVVAYLLLMIVMKDPPYYLMARIDLAGGSTGWHRAYLIQQAFGHINEWWLTGTDYTRHWMPTGVSFSPDHSDITNHYLMAGVLGGLPLMILFILIMWRGFVYVGRALPAEGEIPRKKDLVAWATGAALFGHAATCLAVAYFDQSIAFLYLTLAATSALMPVGGEETVKVPASSPRYVTWRLRAPSSRVAPAATHLLRRHGRTHVQ